MIIRIKDSILKDNGYILNQTILFSGGALPFDPSTSQICYSEQRCDGAEDLHGVARLLFILLASAVAKLTMTF